MAFMGYPWYLQCHMNILKVISILTNCNEILIYSCIYTKLKCDLKIIYLVKLFVTC